jgi:hypothetical protein
VTLCFSPGYPSFCMRFNCKLGEKIVIIDCVESFDSFCTMLAIMQMPTSIKPIAAKQEKVVDFVLSSPF